MALDSRERTAGTGGESGDIRHSCREDPEVNEHKTSPYRGSESAFPMVAYPARASRFQWQNRG